MREVATIMTDSEFKMFYNEVEATLEELYIPYSSPLHCVKCFKIIMNAMTKKVGTNERYYFSDEQVRKLYDLALEYGE